MNRHTNPESQELTTLILQCMEIWSIEVPKEDYMGMKVCLYETSDKYCPYRQRSQTFQINYCSRRIQR